MHQGHHVPTTFDLMRSQIMSNALRTSRSQSWFPGRFVRVQHITGLEVLPEEKRSRHGGAVVGKNVVHGTARELRALAVQLLAAAERVDPTPSTRRRTATAAQLQAA